MAIFQKLAAEAFELRVGLRVPVIKSIVQPFCTSKYTSEGIEKALKSAFGRQNYLFEASLGRVQRSSDRETPYIGSDYTKVAVVTCLQGRNQPTLIANYSRNPLAENGQGRFALAATPY